MKSLIELHNWILSVEERFPVDKWEIEGVNIWPLIRIELFFWHRENLVPHQKTSPSASDLRTSPPSLWTRIRTRLITLKYLFDFYFLKEGANIFVGAESHREIVQGKFFNKFFDTLIENHKQSGTFVVMEYGAVKHRSNYPLHSKLIPLNSIVNAYFFIITKLSKNRFSNQFNCNLPLFDLFRDEIKEHFYLGRALYLLEKMPRKAAIIAQLAQMYKIVFKKIKPKNISVLCYYSDEIYPILIAAKSLNIPTADIQHGPQSGIHPAYTDFMKVPDLGFNTLPKYFLIWDTYTYNHLVKWISGNRFHRAIVFGHPWVSYWKNQSNTMIQKNNAKKKVLFSLQPIGELITKEEIKMIRNTQNEYDWYLRLHPRQKNMKETLIKLTASEKLLVNIEEASETPLPILLASIALHCTRSSGTTLECAIFGIPSLLLDELGKIYYRELIEEGSAIVPSSYISDGFIEGLRRLSNMKITNKSAAVPSIDLLNKLVL